MAGDLIAQIRMNLESVELAARSSREGTNLDGQALYDRIGSMVELLESTRAFLVKAGHAHPVLAAAIIRVKMAARLNGKKRGPFAAPWRFDDAA